MFPTQLHSDLIASSTRALKTLNEVLDNSEKDAQRVSAALGILRLTERVFAKLPLPDGSEGRGVGSSLPLPEGGGRGVGSASAPSPPRAESSTSPASSPAPLITSSSPTALIAASGRALSRSRPLEPDEVAELNTYYSLSYSHLHDPKMASFWRNQLEVGRESAEFLKAERERRAARSQPSVPP